MTGECYINGYDVYVLFGVTPLRGTYAELLKTVAPKAPLTIDWDNENGEEVVFPNLPFLVDARDITIPVAIVARDSADFFRKKAAFEAFLMNGSFLLFFPKLQQAFTCYYQSCESYSQLEPISSRQVSATLNLKIREPNPAKRTLTKEEHAYGVMIDDNQPNPDLVRIGNQNMAKAAVVNDLAMMGTLKSGYLKRFLKNNGLVYEDGSASIIDGTAGSVVTHMPGFYYMVEDLSSSVHNLWVSPYPISGFQYTSFTVGSFEAAVNNAVFTGVPSGALWSVANSSTIFRGGDNNATNDLLQKGYLGKARTMLTRTSFHAAAQLQGVDYGMIDYNAHKALWMLFVTKYATLNTQKTYSPIKDANGYYTGGLGVGVTDVASGDWSLYNGYSPLVKCGVGIGNGMVDSATPVVISSFNTVGDKVVSVPSFMGVENTFGHLWEWMQGINIIKDVAFTAYIYESGIYEDVVTNKYNRLFDLIKTQDWIKTFKLGAFGDVIPSAVGNGASSSTYGCDYFYNDLTLGSRGVLRSGSALLGSPAGLASAFANYAVSSASTYFGSRLGFFGRVRPGV